MDTWLVPVVRQIDTPTIEVIDVGESAPPDDNVVCHMGEAILDACVGLAFFQRAAEILPWEFLQDIRGGSLPSIQNMKRGIFGEVLAARMLETHHGYVIPVKKARYRFGPNASPTGTDVIGMVFDDTGTIEQFCYVECKLRTTNADADRVVSEAHQQLKNDRDTRTPAMVQFVAKVLSDHKDPRHIAVLEYLRDRRDRNIDSFRIVLVWDFSLWSEQVLEEIMQEGDPISPLSIHVVRIADLRPVVERTYASIAITADDDDN